MWILLPARKSIEKYKAAASDMQLLQDGLDAHNSRPVRISAFHFIHPPGALFKLLKALFMLRLASKTERTKATFHSGSWLETQYALQSYGLPIQELPITATGTIKTKNHLLWIKGRKIIDKANELGEVHQYRNGIFHPGLRDVLFSRGGNTTHFGNMELRSMMMDRMKNYNNGGRKERLADRTEIIDLVHKNGGRFLCLGNDGLWVEIVDEKTLMEKLANAFYDINRKSFARDRQQVIQSVTSDFLSPTKRQRTSPVGTDRGRGCI